MKEGNDGRVSSQSEEFISLHFRVSTPKIGISLLFSKSPMFLTVFPLHPCCIDTVEDKTYPAMNSPIHRELDSASFIRVEDCIHKL